MRVLVGIVLLLSLTAAGVSAQATARLGTPAGPPDEAARPLFETGRRAFEAGRYAEALDAFQRVFVLTGHPAMLINIANAHSRLGENRRAAASLEQYLALVPEATDRSVLEARIAALYSQPDAALLPPPPPPPAAITSGPPSAAKPRRASRGLLAGRTFTWIAAGASVAFAAAAGLTWLNANQSFERLALTCGVDGTCSDAQLAAVSEGVTATNLCLAGAALSLTTAVVLFVVEAPPATDTAPRLAAGFDGHNATLGIRGRL